MRAPVCCLLGPTSEEARHAMMERRIPPASHAAPLSCWRKNMLKGKQEPGTVIASVGSIEVSDLDRAEWVLSITPERIGGWWGLEELSPPDTCQVLRLPVWHLRWWDEDLGAVRSMPFLAAGGDELEALVSLPVFRPVGVTNPSYVKSRHTSPR